jgi:predicted ArsR family transcriptional regulator
MAASARWEQRFLGTTRGQVVLLLRRARRTVDELAHSLGLTDNAVRSHLATLERDGLVTQNGVRRGGEGKPAYIYELTHDAEQLFPKAYGLILRELLDVLGQRLAHDEVEGVLREVGRRLAANVSGARTPQQRVQVAVDLLDELGGLAEAEHLSDQQVVIHGYACPLAEVLPEHPAVCRMAETLLSEATGLPVTEDCARGAEPPHCCFRVDLSTPSRS